MAGRPTHRRQVSETASALRVSDRSDGTFGSTVLAQAQYVQRHHERRGGCRPDHRQHADAQDRAGRRRTEVEGLLVPTTAAATGSTTTSAATDAQV